MANVIRPVMEFGDCLGYILKKKDISASELSRRMAYKSRTTVFRILDGQGGKRTEMAFFERLIHEDPLNLTGSEKEHLAQALEISRVGMAGFLTNRAMGKLLLDSTEKYPKISILGRDHEQMESDLHWMKEAQELEIVITGCCDRGLMTRLCDKARELGIEEKIRVRQFFFGDDEEIVQNITAIQPMLYSSYYEAYRVDAGRMSREREWIYRCDAIYVHMLGNDGVWYNQHFMMVERNTFFAIPRWAETKGIRSEEYFRVVPSYMYRVNVQYAQKGVLATYAAYAQDYQALEENCAVYMMKRELPFGLIEPELQRQYLLDCAQVMYGLTETNDDLKKILDSYEGRYRNFATKKQETHIVLVREALIRFAQTGKKSQFFATCRGFTPAERVRILTHIRDKLMRSNTFHLYVFRESGVGGGLPKIRATLYEGKGVRMMPEDIYEHKGRKHAEALIRHRGFQTRFKAYFVNSLLGEHVLSEQETLKLMDELIALAKESKE